MSKAITLGVGTMLIAAGLIWLAPPPTTESAPTAAHVSVEPQAPNTAAVQIPPMEEWDADLVNEFQMQAMGEVMKTLGQAELPEVTERPAFVSPAEWLILDSIAQRHPQPNHELTRMVNYLRFTKLLERWEHTPDLTPPQRAMLTEHLLHTLPARVEHGDLDLSQAQQLQASLVNDLIPDPSARRQRLSHENARIGVVFEWN